MEDVVGEEIGAGFEDVVVDGRLVVEFFIGKETLSNVIDCFSLP